MVWVAHLSEWDKALLLSWCYLDKISLIVYTGCEVYNLGTGKGTSVLEMVKAFEKASGKVT